MATERITGFSPGRNAFRNPILHADHAGKPSLMLVLKAHNGVIHTMTITRRRLRRHDGPEIVAMQVDRRQNGEMAPERKSNSA